MMELRHALNTCGLITNSKVRICIVPVTNYQETKIIQNDVENLDSTKPICESLPSIWKILQCMRLLVWRSTIRFQFEGEC